MPMQIEKSVVLSQKELMDILTKAVQIGDWPVVVSGIDFFFQDGKQMVRLTVQDDPKHTIAKDEAEFADFLKGKEVA